MPANHPLLMLYESLNAALGLSAPANAEPCDGEAVEFSLSAQADPETRARVVLFSQPAEDAGVDESDEPKLAYVVVVLTKLHACVYLGAPELAYRVWFDSGTSEQRRAWEQDLQHQALAMPGQALERYGANLPNGKHCACTQKALEVQREQAGATSSGNGATIPRRALRTTL